MGKYEKLLSPIQIGKVTVKNRIVKAPQSSKAFGGDHMVNPNAVALYEEIAAGGTGMIVVGACLFMPTTPAWNFPGLYDDKFIPGLKELVDAMHKHNSVAIAQLHHSGPIDNTIPGGAMASSTLSGDDLPGDKFYPTRGVTLEEIEEIKESYFKAALRAKEAGFDGVEVHSGNGYFLLSFLSRIWNHRDDQYGPQSMENRTRLQSEVIRGIRERCGEDFIVGTRINAIEFGHPNGLTLEEGAEAAKYLEEAGAQYISVTGYGYGKKYPELQYKAWDYAIKLDSAAAHAPMQFVPDYYAYPEPDDFMKPYANDYKTGLVVPGAVAVKKAVKVPVITVGRLDGNLGEQILEQGKADMIALGRALWVDHFLPKKLMEGREEDIVHCNRCGTCDDLEPGPRLCRVNPSFNREIELAIKPTEKKKHVVVIGGGPAGMEAARVLDLRGHQVTLIEKKNNLGGKLHLATMIKGTDFEDLPSLINYLTTQINKSNVKVMLRKEATFKDIAKLNPDAVVLATGGVYELPDVLGIHNSNVSDVNSLSKLADIPLRMFGAKALSKLSEVALPGIGKNIVVLGGQIEGVQGAVFLAKRGRNVTLLVEEEETGRGIPPRYLRRVYPWFARNGVKVVTDIAYKEITKEGVNVIHKDNSKESFKCDSVMVLLSQKPNDTLLKQVEGKFPEIYRIGSANGAKEGLIVDALREGRRIGVSI